MTSLLRTALRGSRPLSALAGTMTVLFVVCVLGLILDDRQVGGQPVWLKPTKFALSFAIYGLTLAWLLAHLRRGRRIAQVAAGVIVVTAVLEVGIIVMQAARGHFSHYNVLTPFDEFMWRSMGALIIVLWLATAVVAALLWRDGLADRAGTWAVRLGMGLFLVGLLQGSFMLVPTPEQVRLDDAGLDTLKGAHAVGVPDGGPGLPLIGWSTTGGDLRIGHFVGIHGLQAILLFTMLLSLMVSDPGRRARLVVVFAGAYTGLLVLVTWQALRGQPLLAPDAITLLAAAGLALATGLGAAHAWRRPVLVDG